MNRTAPFPWPLPATVKDAYDHFERLVSPSLHVLLGTESMNRVLSGMREQVLLRDRLQRQFLEDTWRALRLPTQSDVSRLAGLVVQVEDRLDDSLLPATPDANDSVTERLERLETAIADLRTLIISQSGKTK
jgi:hypothetical protein